MSVELDPPELHFKRPFDKEVSQILRLTNPHNEPVAFKVKTTAPKQYCVRPNSGRIDPGGYVEVQVLLQAMKQDPAPDAKCKDKFLVQSVAVTADQEFANQWSHIEQTNKAAIQERKIRVAFLPADAATPAPKTNGVAASQGGAPSFSSPIAASTPHDNIENRHVESARSPVADSPAASFMTSVPTNGDDLKAQLAAAQDQIAQLKNKATEQGELRQRQGVKKLEDAGFPNAAQALAHPQSAGVPLQWVAILIFLAFLVGWWVF
ncbi:vesicle-associated membrane protein-associated protein A [Tothia fuscella]|uniref:Vesicle-associated membrane protein-associated protein A n=1 Tax=Tothia fuscella TaxID=1048955 RepID=A0A9P4U0E4_9PEZI|nr:vesicle-associated membrane protein-associated protein A [Tothia fuscella]